MKKDTTTNVIETLLAIIIVVMSLSIVVMLCLDKAGCIEEINPQGAGTYNKVERVSK